MVLLMKQEIYFKGLSQMFLEETTLEALEGTGGREGQSDGIVRSVRNVLDCLERNVEIAMASGEELADQGMALASDQEGLDTQLAYQLFGDGSVTHYEAQLRSSQVELALYRPVLLEDGKGLENAREDQHEERYSTLKSNLTDNLSEVAAFIANPGTPTWGNMSTLCEKALLAISMWEGLIEADVAVEILEEVPPTANEYMAQAQAPAHLATDPAPGREWSDRKPQFRNLGSYIPGNVVEDIAAVKTVLIAWQTAFATTESRASTFATAISNETHVIGLHDRVEQAIYPPSPFQTLQNVANEIKSRLGEQASMYNGFADLIMDNMDGAAREGYAGALRRGADYLLAIGETIETDFFSGNFPGSDAKKSGFDTHNHTTSVWAGKPLAELLDALGICVDTGILTQPIPDEVWENLEYLLGLPYETMTDEMLMALAALFVQLDVSGDPSDLTKFFHLLAQEVVIYPPGPGEPSTVWVFCPNILGHLQSNVNDIAKMAMLMEQALEEIGMEAYFEELRKCEDAYAALVEKFRLTRGDLPENDEELWRFLINSLQQQQQSAFQSSAILQAVGSLGNITGVENGTGPDFNITQESNEGFTVSTTLWEGVWVDKGVFGFSSSHDIEISPILDPSGVHPAASDMMGGDVNAALSFSMSGQAWTEATNIGMAELASKAFENVGGPVMGLVTGVATTIDGINEAEQNLEMFNDHLGNLNSAFLAAQLQLNGIFIDDGNGAPLLILQATVQTEGELAYHNDKFPEMDDVTMADLAANPPEVYSILFPNPWPREEE